MTIRPDEEHHRRSLRLPTYNYASPGVYFVTICAEQRECLSDDPVVAGITTDVWHALPGWFPSVELDEFVVMPNHVHLIAWIRPSPNTGVESPPAGTCAVIDTEHAPGWDTVEQAYANAEAGCTAVDWQSMMTPSNQTQPIVAHDWVIPSPGKVNPSPKLGDVIGAFKSLTVKVYLDWVRSHDPTRRATFWQRNYYEHIIRNERELKAIRGYIRNNPLQWALDRDNPENIRHLSPPTDVREYLLDIRLE